MAAVLQFGRRDGARSQESFAALHTQFSGPLKRFFRGYRLNAADVEDLTQEVFIRLAAPGSQTDLRKPDAFVFTLARNLVRDRARRLYTRAVAQSVTIDDIELSCERPTPDHWLELSQELAGVENALSSLKPRTCEAFTLHRVHGESYAAIAKHMSISVSMVEKHIMSAMRALRCVSPHQTSHSNPPPCRTRVRKPRLSLVFSRAGQCSVHTAGSSGQ
jgi:RNA polymerase sigma factor (sigma-70 family)